MDIKTLIAALFFLFCLNACIEQNASSVHLTNGIDASAGGGSVYIITTDLATYYLEKEGGGLSSICLLYTSPSPRDQRGSRMPSSA